MCRSRRRSKPWNNCSCSTRLDPMPPPTDVTAKEVDDAFYASYGEGTAKGLAPGLGGPGGVGRRKLTLNATDDKFRACWMEVRRLLREKKGVCPVTKGAP